jgi:hypothetical protein
MAEAYRFLFGRSAEGPPSASSLFIYCHPSKVEQKPLHDWSMDAPTALGAPEPGGVVDAVAGLFQSDRNVPSWIAATERYLEQRNLDMERMLYEDERSGSIRPSTRRFHKNAALIQDTLRQVQDTLSRFATETDSGDDNV